MNKSSLRFVFAFCILLIGSTPIVFAQGMYGSFSPDGKKVATQSTFGPESNSIKIWDVQTGALLTELKSGRSELRAFSFSPDSKNILIISKDDNAEIRNAQTGALLTRLKGNGNKLFSASFSSDGKKIVRPSFTPEQDNNALIGDSKTGEPLIVLKGHRYDLNPIKVTLFSPDDKKVLGLAPTNDYYKRWKALLWDAESEALPKDLGLVSYNANSSIFSPDGKKVITTEDNGWVKIWDAKNSEQLNELKVSGVIAVFSPDGKKIATGNIGGTVSIYDALSGALLSETKIKEDKNKIKSICFSPDGKKLVTTCKLCETANIWDTENGALLVELKGHSDYVDDACFSPDGHKILTVSDDQTAMIWSAKDGTFLNEFDHQSPFATINFWLSEIKNRIRKGKEMDIDFDFTDFENELSHIIKLVPRVNQLPPLPDEAGKNYILGLTLIKEAKSKNDYVDAISELKEVMLQAPWFSDIYKDLGLAFELNEQYDEAIMSFKLFLLTNPPEEKARKVQYEIYVIKAQKEKSKN